MDKDRDGKLIEMTGLRMNSGARENEGDDEVHLQTMNDDGEI